jgi:hypothetical protein
MRCPACYIEGHRKGVEENAKAGYFDMSVSNIAERVMKNRYTVRFGWRFHVRQTVCRRGLPNNFARLCVIRFVGHGNAHKKRTV